MGSNVFHSLSVKAKTALKVPSKLSMYSTCMVHLSNSIVSQLTAMKSSDNRCTVFSLISLIGSISTSSGEVETSNFSDIMNGLKYNYNNNLPFNQFFVKYLKVYLVLLVLLVVVCM